MKRIAFGLAALGVLSMFSAPANASDLSVLLRQLAYGHHGRHIARENHARHHDDLEHRAVHRELDHRAAHRYPMTYRQHGNLHDRLDHEAFHDGVEHRSAHRTRAYSPYRNFRELRDEMETLGRILVPTPSGAQIPLEQLAQLHCYESSAKATRSVLSR